jgi:hypothetical protein
MLSAGKVVASKLQEKKILYSKEYMRIIKQTHVPNFKIKGHSTGGDSTQPHKVRMWNSSQYAKADESMEY